LRGIGGGDMARTIGDVVRADALILTTVSSSRGSRNSVIVESLKLSGSTAVVEDKDPVVPCRSWMNSS
jgi:hypothetical protein